MPPIVPPIVPPIAGTGPVRAANPAAPRETRAEPRPAAAPASAEGPVAVTTDALAAGAPPVDAERVAEIRHAIEQGHYPVIPARIADAMIAAGLLLRAGQ